MKPVEKPMPKYIIDRFEDKYAICEDESKGFTKIPKYKLPLGCKEGDTIFLNPEGYYQLDPEASKKDEERIREKMNRIFDQK